MAEANGLTPVVVPERSVPPPSTISAAAQAALSLGAAAPRLAWPDPADHDGWRARIAERGALFEEMVRAMMASVTIAAHDVTIGGVPCYRAEAEGWQAGRDPLYLFIHGGAFVFGGGPIARAQGAANATRLEVACVSVDYRMPPDHPFPAAPEDCLSVYEALLEEVPAGRIVIGGASAGGNLAAVTALMIRDRGLPAPAGVVLLTPEVDLTEAGDSFQTHVMIDTVLKGGLPECNALYAGGAALDTPYLSPLMADLAGFPPTFVQAGTRDLFLSNAAMFHRKLRKAGVRADLHVWEGMPHGGFGGSTPEDAEVYEEVAAFLRSVT